MADTHDRISEFRPQSRDATAPECEAKQLVGRAHAIALDSEGWLDLQWVGRWVHTDGPEEVDEPAIRLMLANQQARAKAFGEDWAGIPVYKGHPEVDGTLAEAEAQAWVKRFRIDSATGRLQGLPEWCGDAKTELIESRRYKFISCYEWGQIDAESGVFVPYDITSIGLTNNPVKLDGQHPLANARRSSEQEAGMPETTEAGAAAPEAQRTEQAQAAATIGPLPRPNALADDAADRIREVIGDAEDTETALDAIYRELYRLWDRERELNGMASVIGEMANALGVCEAPAEDVTARVNALVDSETRARADAAEAVKLLHETLTENAVLRGVLPDEPQARANAIKALNADREAVTQMWDRQATNPTAGRANSRPGIPPDPTRGTRPGSARANAGGQKERIARARAWQQAHGGTWGDACRAVADGLS